MYSALFPIEQIRLETLSAEARQFSQSIRTYTEWVEPGHSIGQQYRVAQQAQAAGSEWGQRAHYAVSIAGFMQSQSLPTSIAYKYKILGTTAAIILLTSHPDVAQPNVSIDWLASHPGSNRAAKMLVEKAANVSHEQGFNGVLTVTSIRPQSDGFYRSMGFTGSPQMLLTPSASPNWSRASGVWRLN